jgi:hypothetical protein
MRFLKPEQILAIASLSSPQSDANPFLKPSLSEAKRDMPGLRAPIHLPNASHRWRRRRDYGNLRHIRIKFAARATPDFDDGPQ